MNVYSISLDNSQIKVAQNVLMFLFSRRLNQGEEGKCINLVSYPFNLKQVCIFISKCSVNSSHSSIVVQNIIFSFINFLIHSLQSICKNNSSFSRNFPSKSKFSLKFWALENRLFLSDFFEQQNTNQTSF